MFCFVFLFFLLGGGGGGGIKLSKDGMHGCKVVYEGFKIQCIAWQRNALQRIAC